MGSDRTTVSTSSNQQATATPEETELNRLSLDRIKANAPNQQTLDTNLYDTINKILTGGTLPNNLQGIGGINEDQTKSMVNQAIMDVTPQFQSAGILDSGIAAQLATRTAADIRNQNAQFNVQALQQLFNQALGGGSNLQGNTNQQTSILGSQLAGLRSINSSGNQTTSAMNPFLKTFQESAGKNLGSWFGK